MKTYPDENVESGCAVGFEINNIYVSRRAVAHILRSIKDVTEVKARKLFSRWEAVHIWFKYMNHDCVVVEPFGDSSRYWIGPENTEQEFDFSEVENAFKRYRPPFHRQIVGDIVSLRLFKRFIGSNGQE